MSLVFPALGDDGAAQLQVSHSPWLSLAQPWTLGAGTEAAQASIRGNVTDSLADWPWHLPCPSSQVSHPMCPVRGTSISWSLLDGGFPTDKETSSLLISELTISSAEPLLSSLHKASPNPSPPHLTHPTAPAVP